MIIPRLTTNPNIPFLCIIPAFAQGHVLRLKAEVCQSVAHKKLHEKLNHAYLVRDRTKSSTIIMAMYVTVLINNKTLTSIFHPPQYFPSKFFFVSFQMAMVEVPHDTDVLHEQLLVPSGGVLELLDRGVDPVGEPLHVVANVIAPVLAILVLAAKATVP
jgi:hypothetical protein